MRAQDCGFRCSRPRSFQGAVTRCISSRSMRSHCLPQVLERWVLHELKQLIAASSEPLTTAKLQRTRGRLLYYLGHYDDAAKHLDECASALRALLSSDHSDTVSASARAAAQPRFSCGVPPAPLPPPLTLPQFLPRPSHLASCARPSLRRSLASYAAFPCVVAATGHTP
jgi:hypothetical protein